MRREELTRMLAEECPEAGVVGLRFSVADHVPAAAGPPPPPAPPAPPVPSAVDRREGERASEGVDDPQVRDLVARAAAAAAARLRASSDT